MGKNLDIVKGIYDAFTKGDVPAVLGAFDFQHLVERIDNFAVLPERFVEAGDTVVVEGRYQGTMKATGTPVDAQCAHVWQLRDGKVVRFQQYTDTRQRAEAAAPRR